MAESATQQDSPLSITSSVAGILTFFVAIVAAIYVRVTYLRNSDEEYFKVKTSLSWFKTESQWLTELIRAAGNVDRPGFTASQYRGTMEYQMYTFVMDDLLRLEERLLELLTETEEKAAGGEDMKDARLDGQPWTLVPRSWAWWSRTTVAMSWLPVRTKALELVRQRDALTARVLFTQMSLISSRIRDLEHRADGWEIKTGETTHRLEDMIGSQRGELRRLEDVVHRVMRRSRAGNGDMAEEQPSLSPP